MNKYVLFACMLLGILNITRAQDSTNMKHYFDDGKNYELLHHALKVGITPLSNGEANLYYEYTPFKFIGVELGGGILLPYRTISAWSIVDIPVPNETSYNLQAYLKIKPMTFRQSYWIQQFSFFVGVKQTWLNAQIGQHFVLRNYLIGAGFGVPLSNHWRIDVDCGFGLSFVMPESRIPLYFTYDPSKPLTAVAPLDIKLSFAF